jgi:hypothetical protein
VSSPEGSLFIRGKSLPSIPIILTIGSLALLFYLEAVRILLGEPFNISSLMVRVGFCAMVLIGSMLIKMDLLIVGQHRMPRQAIGLMLIGLLSAVSAIWVRSFPGALTALAVGYILLLIVDRALVHGLSWRGRWFTHLLLAGMAGASATASAQIVTRFSEEEFYIALQAVILSLLWLLLCIVFNAAFPAPTKVTLRRGDRPIQRLHLVLLLAISVIIGSVLTINFYQNSFFPPDAPGYGGISQENPFICGTGAPDERVYEAIEVHRGLVELVQANPNKQAPEYALLALVSQKPEQAEEFRLGLLDEAADGRFSGPANSIKYGQYQASIRVYFYIHVREAFPDLFSELEHQQIQEWFAAINRRAQTVEWVDWMYATAFGYYPQGPYENQESGAGLLALLEWKGLGEQNLSDSNQAYLKSTVRGWQLGFRNSDDAIIYQPEWINNAYFQALYQGDLDETNLRHSFDWLLWQTPPEGQSLRYNHVGYVHFAVPAYLGYQLTEDATLLWLAGRSLDYLKGNGYYLSAQPGLEMAPWGSGLSPTTGSCLLFGETGIPTRTGPLGPDKIVFRDGWLPESNYLLLNLRFSGWHRYKASNTVITAFQEEPLLEEQYRGTTMPWLPEGRSLFRDKRIPRENLNGLLVERTGLDAVLYQITSIGSPWAQDPPYFAKIENFETSPELDTSITWLEGWQGWDHKREVYFYHQGPSVIIDQARGPSGRLAAITWHAPSGKILADQHRINLLEGKAEMVLLPILPGEVRKTTEEEGLAVQFVTAIGGELGLVTILLTGDWYGADADLVESEGLIYLNLRQQERIIRLPVNGLYDDGG